MEIKAIQPFIDKKTKKQINPDTVITVDAKRGADIISRGLGVEYRKEDSPPPPSSNTTDSGDGNPNEDAE